MEIKPEIRNAPRWFILGIDVLVCLISICLSFFLRFDFQMNEPDMFFLKGALISIFFVRLSSFILFKSYAGVIRYTGSKDIQRIFLVLITGSAFLFLLNLVVPLFNVNYNIPRTIIAIDFMVSLVIMVAFRLTIKISYEQIKNSAKNKSSVMIYGAGEFGTITKRALDRDAGTKYTVVAFVDDNLARAGMKIEGINIISNNTTTAMVKTRIRGKGGGRMQH